MYIYVFQMGSWSEWVTAFATIFAIVIALYGEWLKVKIFPSKLEITGKSLVNQKNSNGNEIGYTRLRFTNNGRTSAKNVTVYIEKIYDNHKLRKRFLPVPLRWTHDGQMSRDILVNQNWFLDLCALDNYAGGDPFPHFVLAAGRGIPSYDRIKKGITKIMLVIYQESGTKMSYQVILKWNRKNRIVKIVNYKKN